ncbi:MAG: RHS repeat-associated core domain-containing protein [Verrucomicrobiota bacterium]
MSPTNEGINGNSWFVKEVPSLVQTTDGGNDYVVAIGTINDAVWFLSSGGTYTPRDYAKETLAHDAVNKRFILRFDLGQVMKFYDFDASHPAAKRGAFESFTDQAGRTVTVSFGANDLISEFAQVNGSKSSYYTYVYHTSGASLDRLRWVTLRVDGEKVRQAEYDYYDGTDSFGSAGDLRRVKLQEWDGSVWVTTATHYYRYYKAGDVDGVVNGLRYVVSPLGYSAMVAAGITPETATDAQIAQYSVHAFKYDTDRSVKQEAVNGGTQNFGFTYGVSAFSDGPNNWKWRTVQTLPDGNRQMVYTNFQGLVILKVLQQMVAGAVVAQWGEYYQYDDKARITLRAQSSAIDLATINDGSAGVVSLKTSTGLVTTFEYYGTTPPTGGVTGYLQYQKIKQGSGGTVVKVGEWLYTTRTVGSDRRVVPWKDIVYQSDASGGSDAATTEYTYTWQGSTLQIDELTVTLPVVATTQNGSGTATSWKQKFDAYGRVTWKLDERGYITGYTYDLSTDGLTKVVEDASVSTPWTPVAGSHLNLTTDMTVDLRGRPTQSLGPVHTIDVGGTATGIRRATWTVYKDDSFETWVGQGYQKTSDSSFTLVNPVRITRQDAAGRVTDEIGATRGSTVTSSGKLQASDSLPQSGWVSWSKNVYAGAPGLASTRSYFVIPSTGEGTAGTHYNQQIFGYDNMRRKIRTLAPDGTITRYVFNPLGWVTELWVGTDDTGATATNPAGAGGANNMSKVEAYEYDGNTTGGNGNRTKLTQWEDASNTRVTTYGYDYRDRQISQDGEIDFYETYAYDNLDRLTQTDRRNTTSVGALVTRNETKYDPLGRVYQRLEYSVSGGTAGNSLKDKVWYGPSGLEIKRVVAGDRAFTKTQHDQVGRPSKVFQCFDTAEADTDYTAAGTVTSDTVVEQVENTWDDGGNVIQTVNRQRFHDATSTGELTTPGGTQPKARVSYVASYPDGVGRTQASADYGTNAAASFSRPSTIPARSDTVLVASTEYDMAGRASKVTDPKAIENITAYDAAGRVTKTIENYVSGGTGTDQNRTTEMTYTARNQLKTLTAKNSVTGDQVTIWVYGVVKGVGSTDSDVARNDLLRAKEYPDKASASDRVEYRYDRLGEVKEIKDQAGTIRTLQYDKLGRLRHDRVTTLASGVDGAIRRILRQYNVRGLLDKLTSYDNQDPNLGTIVNEVAYTYNGFGQVTYEYQSHSGVVGGSTPSVQYAYTDGSANHARRTSVTYPAGTVISVDYGTAGAADDVLNRVKQLKNSTTVLVDYSYLGKQQVVIGNYSGEPGVELTYYTSGGSGDAGDQYTGLDRFGRIIDQRWRKTSDNTDRERVKYGYDRASNRQWRQNTVAVTGQDEYYTYDGLSQVKTLDRGTLNGTFTGITGTPSWEEDWNYDPTGNWNGTSTGYLTKASGTTQLNQNRTHNVVNEITDITETTGTAWPTPTFNAPGNMTLAPQPKKLGDSYDFKYDAWNRLTEIKPTGGTVEEAYQYDGAFRRVTKVTSSGTRHYYYSDQWQVLEERLDASTSADRWFVWGERSIDDLILRHRSSERLYALGDALNITAVISTAGAVQERYGYTGFGTVRYLNASFGTGSNSYDWETLFASYRYDTGSGLYQVRYRYYHTGLGRWASRDLVEYEYITQSYDYVLNNALNLIDSMGLAPTREGGDTDGCCSDDGDDYSCCVCMLYCEGEAGCERVDYWIMTNRQNTNWPDFKGETDFCGQAMSSAFGCGFNKSKAPKFDQCCKNDASATAKRLKPIVSICDNPGTDPTGGAQYFWTKNKTPKWMKEDEVRKGNCKKVTVRGCSQDIWKCKNRPIA